MRHDATTVPTGLPLLKRVPPLLGLAVALLGLATVTFADEGTTGPNGGQIKDAGKHHLELAVKENALMLYVTDAKHQKIMTKGASGTATVLAGKNTANVKLEPSGENALAGSGKFESTPDMKVVVSLTLAGENPIQARFTPLEKAKGK
ncbi:MAG TPA: hypothetical protein VGT81_22745 [Casimicrobiaceae bacterium]|nr:hypothetical protein [Casimicrobiaceae bacterium]